MAQSTSELWNTLLNTSGTTQEFAFDIDGTWYGSDAEVEHSVINSLFESFGFGNAVSATLELVLFADDIPRGATIKRYVRLVSEDGETVSEWLPKGRFYINTRSVDDGLWTITAYDAMRRADTIWTPDDALEFPMTMADAVDVLAGLMGITVDSRTELNSSYTIDYPANDYTIRNILCYIAAAHGGNWIVSDTGELYLARVYGPYDEMSAVSAIDIFAFLSNGRVADSVPLAIVGLIDILSAAYGRADDSLRAYCAGAISIDGISDTLVDSSVQIVSDTPILILGDGLARVEETLRLASDASILIGGDTLGEIISTIPTFATGNITFDSECLGRLDAILRIRTSADTGIRFAQDVSGQASSSLRLYGGKGTIVCDGSGTLEMQGYTALSGGGTIEFLHTCTGRTAGIVRLYDLDGAIVFTQSCTGTIIDIISITDVGGNIIFEQTGTAQVSDMLRLYGGESAIIFSQTCSGPIVSDTLSLYGGEGAITISTDYAKAAFAEPLPFGAANAMSVCGEVTIDGTETEDDEVWAELIDSTLNIYRAYSTTQSDTTLTVE